MFFQIRGSVKVQMSNRADQINIFRNLTSFSNFWRVLYGRQDVRQTSALEPAKFDLNCITIFQMGNVHPKSARCPLNDQFTAVFGSNIKFVLKTAAFANSSCGASKCCTVRNRHFSWEPDFAISWRRYKNRDLQGQGVDHLISPNSNISLNIFPYKIYC